MIESCRISVGCLKENSALQHIEIKIIMDAYQIVLANTSPNYSVFWVILTLSKSRKIALVLRVLCNIHIRLSLACSEVPGVGMFKVS